MVHARGRVFRGGRAVKRDNIWLTFAPTEFTIASASTAQLLFVLNAAALLLRPFTIVRTRFQYGMRSDQTSAIEDQICGVGQVVVQDTASGIGITAVPTPITDGGSDFHSYELLYGRFVFISGIGVDPQGLCVNRPVDSKAMRKVDFGQDLVITAETTGSSEGVQLIVGGRVLVKLH